MSRSAFLPRFFQQLLGVQLQCWCELWRFAADAIRGLPFCSLDYFVEHPQDVQKKCSTWNAIRSCSPAGDEGRLVTRACWSGRCEGWVFCSNPGGGFLGITLRKHKEMTAAVVLRAEVLKSAQRFGVVGGAGIKSEKKKDRNPSKTSCCLIVFCGGNHPVFGKVVCHKAWNEHICWCPANNLYPFTGSV